MPLKGRGPERLHLTVIPGVSSSSSEACVSTSKEAMKIERMIVLCVVIVVIVS